MPSTRPGEYLVVARKGRLINLGEAVNTSFLPGTVWVKVPATQQESIFEMTQETLDGIPLRFKGLIIYRIVRPELTAALFDFSAAEGQDTLARLMNQCCLGELRDQVSRLTMKACIEQRKTTLTQAVAGALEALVKGSETDWGVRLEVVQVAQVFIVDATVRHQLESSTRNEIRAKSELDVVAADEAILLAKTASERRLKDLEERGRVEAERAQLEAEVPLHRDRHEQKMALLKSQLIEVDQELTLAQKQMEVELVAKRAEQALLLERLPIEQRPALAEAASKVLQGAKLSVYGEDSRLLGALEPLLELLGETFRGTTSREP